MCVFLLTLVRSADAADVTEVGCKNIREVVVREAPALREKGKAYIQTKCCLVYFEPKHENRFLCNI